MNRQTLLLATALLVTVPAAAQAADLGWNNGGGASTIYSSNSAFNWTGFYAGVSGGYGWGTLNREDIGGGNNRKDDTNGWNLGGTVGYNMDMGGFVVGAEADLSWTNIAFSQNVGGTGEYKSSVDAFGTLRARGGMAFGQVMPYATLGVAWGRGTSSFTDNNNVVTSQSNNHLGWTAGVGLEAAATENITFKAEYLYVDLGSQRYGGLPGGAANESTQRFGVIRAGVNYKF